MNRRKFFSVVTGALAALGIPVKAAAAPKAQPLVTSNGPDLTQWLSGETSCAFGRRTGSHLVFDVLVEGKRQHRVALIHGRFYRCGCRYAHIRGVLEGEYRDLSKTGGGYMFMYIPIPKGHPLDGLVERPERVHYFAQRGQSNG